LAQVMYFGSSPPRPTPRGKHPTASSMAILEHEDAEAGASADSPLVAHADGGGLQEESSLPRAGRPGGKLLGACVGFCAFAVLALPRPRAAVFTFMEQATVQQSSARQAIFSPKGPPAWDSLVSLTEMSDFNDMLDAVNKQRQHVGLDNLCYNEKLNAAAKRHSDDMESKKFMSHTGSDGTSPFERMTDAGYNWQSAAENVAQGQLDVAEVMESWMNSPGHKANILKQGMSQFGFARTGDYWTQVFGSPFGDEECKLVGGGEDNHGGRCKDSKQPDGTVWHDADGGEFHCDWYSKGDRCKKHGNSFANAGLTATKACCTCGGGCLDKVPEGMAEWHDSDGEGYHCDWYSVGDRCQEHGGQFENGGMTAKDACCACGGGCKAGDDDCNAESAVTATSDAGGDAGGGDGAGCGESCQSHSDCRGGNSILFCCPYHKLCMDRQTKSTQGPNC